MSIMKRYMKQRRINFFQSPHPRHIDFNNLRENQFHFEEDAEIHEQRLFMTPVRCNVAANQSPNINIDPYFTQNPSPSKRLYPKDYFHEDSQRMQNQQQQHSMGSHQINEKLEFSQEQQLLIPLTPEKIAVVEEAYQNTATAKKNQSSQNTQMIESKFYERGLKKLAFQAFQFVSHQKKTTYKEVAKRLISQINDENEFDVHKKGQMNIKRRVYDALNVLIALGLLKRNGNKILGKKSDSQAIFFGRQAESRQNQSKKEEVLQFQLKNLKNDFRTKSNSLKQKQLTLEKLKQRISRFKEITQRNREESYTSAKKDNISLPFFGICLGDMAPAIPAGQNLTINQEHQQNLYLSCSEKYKIQLMGDFDLIQRLKPLEQQYKTHEKERSKKIKQK